MQGIIILDKVPENCRDCTYKTVYYARELEEDNYMRCNINHKRYSMDDETRPKSCPINTDEAIVSFINLLKNGLKEHD